VLGRPIAHSLSPALHNAAYVALGLPWSYEAIDCGAAELERTLATRPDWAGFSLTMPLKRVGFDLAVERAPRAVTVGAANTLLPGPDGWVADNTDVAGILGALADAGVLPGSATILGAGGTAQAVVAALAELGLSACTVLVRDVTRTTELRRTAEAAGIAITVAVLTVDAASLGAELVLSTLPAGAADPLAAFPWRPGQAVLDVIYAPWPTPLAAAVRQGAGTVLSGASMLLHQAAAQVVLMTGRPAPADAMRAALRAVAGPDAV
jgi:shikimate dehydrogenase